MAYHVVIGSARPGDHGPLLAALGRRGIEARAFADGQATVEAARDRPPDLVVVDLHLGGLHGVDVARMLDGYRTAVLVDEDDAGLGDLRRLGLDVLVRPQGGADGLAEDLETRVKGASRMLEDLGRLEDVASLRGHLLDLVGGDEDKLVRTVLEDPDTHLLSAAYVKRWRVEEEWLRCRTAGRPLAVLRIGLHGGGPEIVRRHGAQALRDIELRLAGLLLSELDGSDLPAREGSGRFVVLMPDTAPEAAARRAFVVQRELAELEFEGRQGPLRAGVCMGLAASPDPHLESAADFLGRAEEALRAAERLGTGRVCLWKGVEELREEDYRGAGGEA
ncbi:MAG: diguanylate cyclase [Planctomycetes bacterium]|nr:diguanylate cyclase [Planctomycetota bacterium]